MRRAFLILALFTIGAVPGRGEGEAEKPRIPGMYSNLEYIEEAGDLLGMEVYLVYGGGEDCFAFVQCAGGEPAAPVLAPVQVSGSKVSFNLPKNQPECGTSFTGVVSEAGLRGRFAGDQKDEWLPRRKGYWE
jgi:hypothetical protein